MAIAQSAIASALAEGERRLGGIDSLEEMSGTVTGRSVGRNLFAGFGEVRIADRVIPVRELYIDPASGSDSHGFALLHRQEPPDDSLGLFERIAENSIARMASDAFVSSARRSGLSISTPGMTSLTMRDSWEQYRRVHPIVCSWEFPDLSGRPLRPGRENPVARSQTVHAQLVSALQYASEDEGWSMRRDAAKLRKQKIAPSDREIGQLSIGLSRILEESGEEQNFEVSAKFYGYGTLRRVIATMSIRGQLTGRGGSIGLRIGRGTAAMAASTEEQVDAQLLEEHRRSRFARASADDRARRFGRRDRT